MIGWMLSSQASQRDAKERGGKNLAGKTQSPAVPNQNAMGLPDWPWYFIIFHPQDYWLIFGNFIRISSIFWMIFPQQVLDD